MNNTFTIKKICEIFWDLEEKNDLFNKKINNIYYWKIVRNTIFNIIANSLGLFGFAQRRVKRNIIIRLYYLFIRNFNSLFFSVGRRKKKIDILVFESGRKSYENGKYIDIYTKYIVEDLKKKNEKFEIVDLPDKGKHFSKFSKERSYFEHYNSLNTINYKKKEIIIDDEDKKVLKSILNDLNKKFNLSIDLYPIVIRLITKFKYEESFFTNLFKRRCVKEVYLICSYGKESIVSACHKNNIDCIEIQHGTMSKYHLGYSFPHNKNIPYFPNKMFLFGEYWFKSTPLPIDRRFVYIYGFPHLEKTITDINKIKKGKEILFISQGTIGEDLVNIAYNYAKKHINLKVYYKLHPGEYDGWQKDYPDLLEALKLENFELVLRKDNIYEFIQNEIEYVVGVYSTMIFEATLLECKIIIMRLPGYEYLDFAIENKYFSIAENLEELEEFINAYPIKKISSNFFKEEINK